MVILAVNLGWAQDTKQPQDRLREAITDSSMVTLDGNVHPALAHATSAVPVDASFPMEHMILLLQPDRAQQVALDELVEQQQDRQSSQFRQFLTPEQFAARFGASQNDIAKITAWLSRHGFTVEEVTANRLSIVFSGDAYAVESTFRTEVKQYSVNGELHHANASDPQIPAALAGVVRGVVKLHDFHAHSFTRGLRPVDQTLDPLYTASPATHYMAPADFVQIYDLAPLYSAGLNGAGQSIALVGRSNIQMADVEKFRAQFGLAANNPTVIVAQGSDPGFTGTGDSTEATLDVEWAAAVAPKAQVKLVIAGSTATADGVDLAAMYAVNHNVAPVLSVSFGSCESDMLSSSSPNSGTELAFYNSLWQQAAAEGISVFVAAGDSGAADCDSSSATHGTRQAINGICSSPYATCVGGTEFHEGTNAGAYWLSGNNAVMGSAESYIPEIVWNESGSDLAASGGGASIVWPKPNWQTGTGVPADGHRDVPDVSLSASTHDGYLICIGGQLSVVGGTSASSPSLAGLFTLVNQKYSNTQGNVNPVLYLLALKQSQGGGAVFHDITTGNNSVPGVTGYSAGIGYDLASGLGSVDAQQLVNHWHDVSPNGALALTPAAASVSLQAGQNASVRFALSVGNGFNWPATFSVSGLPSGVVATFSEGTLPAPGSGATSIEFASAGIAVPGSYNVIVTASGAGLTTTAAIALTVTPIPLSCAFAATPAQLSLNVGGGTNVRLTCSASVGTLPKSLALAVSGQPAGVSASFSSSTLVPGNGVISLTILTAATTAAGTYSLAITASSGTFSQTLSFPLTIVTPPSFTITAGSAVAVTQGSTGALQIQTVHAGAFASALSLAVSTLPAGMTGTFTSVSFAAPGDGTSTLTLAPTQTTPPGTYNINVIATGGGMVKSAPVVVTVNAAPSFTFAAGASALAVQAGNSAGSVALTIKNLTGNFNSAVTFSVTGLPTGATGAFTAATLAAPGAGTSALTISTPATVTPGQYRVVVAASGGTASQSVGLLLTVLAPVGFTLKSSISSLALTPGAGFTSTLSIAAQNNFNAPVTLAIGTLPAGITATLSSTTIPEAAETATLTIQTAATLAAGSYSLSVTGTSNLIATALPAQTATLTITIGQVKTTLAAATLTVARSASASLGLSVAATNFSGSSQFSVSGMPANVTYTFAPTAIAGSGATTLTISPTSSAKTGVSTVTVKTSAGGTVSTATFQLTIN